MKLAILDRDGVINFDSDQYIKSPAEWRPIPGSIEAIARLHQAGYRIAVATNQSGIGRGMIDMTSVNAVHQHMMKLLSEKGGRIDAVFFCPHAATEQCECRKPAPGLMHDIGERYGVELGAVPMVCDTLRDLEAARAAGCQPHLVRSGRAAVADDATIAQWLEAVPGTKVHKDMAAFAEHVIGN
jgi:D-glycero-D-manno-heptose 1,7-bisphosphate phosphatase